jgi:hypothetical protein
MIDDVEAQTQASFQPSTPSVLVSHFPRSSDRSSLSAGADEDFGGEISVLALGLLGTGGKCHQPRLSGCSGGRGAALA